MAFKFTPITSIKRVVTIEVPSDYGKTAKADFEAEFKRHTITGAKELVEKLRNKSIDDAELLRENVKNIAGLTDSEGNDVEFTAELFEQMIDEAYIRGPLLAALLDVNFNLEKLRQKNSQR